MNVRSGSSYGFFSGVFLYESLNVLEVTAVYIRKGKQLPDQMCVLFCFRL